MITLQKSNYQDNEEYFMNYINEVENCIESFLEEFILEGEVYSIYINNKHQGYFTYYDDVFEILGFRVLTQFVIDDKSLRFAQAILEKIINEYEIKSAFVYSDDRLLLSYGMDLHKSVTMQAYVYNDGISKVNDASYPFKCLRKIDTSEIEKIQQITNGWIDFLLTPKKQNRYQIFALEVQGEILGIGLLESSKIISSRQSLGIYTVEKYRQQGVARSIMLHLKKICYQNGYTPITGCNWYNTKSKRAIESTGFISIRRIYKIEFTDDQKWVSI